MDNIITILNTDSECRSLLGDCFKSDVFRSWKKRLQPRIYLGSGHGSDRQWIEVDKTGAILDQGKYAHVFVDCYKKAVEIAKEKNIPLFDEAKVLKIRKKSNMKDTITWFTVTETSGRFTGSAKTIRSAILAARKCKDPYVGCSARSYFYEDGKLIRTEVHDGKKWKTSSCINIDEAMFFLSQVI